MYMSIKLKFECIVIWLKEVFFNFVKCEYTCHRLNQFNLKKVVKFSATETIESYIVGSLGCDCQICK